MPVIDDLNACLAPAHRCKASHAVLAPPVDPRTHIEKARSAAATPHPAFKRYRESRAELKKTQLFSFCRRAAAAHRVRIGMTRCSTGARRRTKVVTLRVHCRWLQALNKIPRPHNLRVIQRHDRRIRLHVVTQRAERACPPFVSAVESQTISSLPCGVSIHNPCCASLRSADRGS